MRSRVAKLLPTDEEHAGEFARLCTIVLEEAAGLLRPLSSPASYERVAAEHQALDLVRLGTPEQRR